MHRRPVLASIALLALLSACGGGGGSTPAPPPGPTPATRLTYTDPTTGTYQLRQNPGLSTPTHLVLELWGPGDTQGCGATLGLTLGGTSAAWRNVSSTDAAGTYVANGTAFDLGALTPILKAKVSGNTLTAAVSEKGLASPKALNRALLRVAVDLVGNPTSGTVIPITPEAGWCQVLLANGTRPSVTVATSSITAQ